MDKAEAMSRTEEQRNSSSDSAAEPSPASQPGSGTIPSTKTARPVAKLQYVDRPEIAETFSDSINGLVFDGQVLRIEFTTTRLDEVKPNSPITGRRYPACRIVLSPSGAVDLINRIQQIAAALRQAASAKHAAQPGEAVD